MIGNNIRRYLDERGIRQTFLRDKTGIPQSKVNQILNEKRSVSAYELQLIADALGVSMDTFRVNEEG